MSRLADAGAPAAAALLAGIRWALQGSGNVYSDPSRSYYQPDPDLGWRFVEQGPLWLGLDVVGGLVITAIATYAFGAWLDRRPDADRLREGLAGRVIWALGLATLALPIAAFVSGGLPDGARETLPEQAIEAPDDGINAHLAGLPAGRYAVLEGHERNAIIASVAAGGETFETRFGGVSGSWQLHPGDLRQPMQAQVSADPATVDTGLTARSNHAREYLEVEDHPTLGLRFEALTGSEAIDGGLRIAADGRLDLIGDELPVEVTATMRVLDAPARARLKIAAEYAVRVEGNLTVRIADTKLKPSASDFSAETIPIRVELIFVRQ